MSHPPLEVPVFGASAALHALQANLIHRLELNRQNSYPQGGLTPTLADLHRVLHEHHHHATPPLRIMIRPRGPPPDGSADFLYSDDELVAMREQIGEFVESGLMRREQGDGFVFGVLAKSGDGVVVDVDKCRELVQLAAPWPCVFHRAFDDIIGSKASSPQEALADLDCCQFHGLLTSGGPGSAADNTENLAAVLRGAAQSQYLREVIIGGGVRSSNVPRLVEALLPVEGNTEVWFHSSCLTNAMEHDTVDVEEAQGILNGLVARTD